MPHADTCHTTMDQGTALVTPFCTTVPCSSNKRCTTRVLWSQNTEYDFRLLFLLPPIPKPYSEAITIYSFWYIIFMASSNFHYTPYPSIFIIQIFMIQAQYRLQNILQVYHHCVSKNPIFLLSILHSMTHFMSTKAIISCKSRRILAGCI